MAVNFLLKGLLLRSVGLMTSRPAPLTIDSTTYSFTDDDLILWSGASLSSSRRFDSSSSLNLGEHCELLLSTDGFDL
jgi:hypothetical protein